MAVILAAGRSMRMGCPKLLLPWGGTSVLGHLVRQWQILGARQIGVVCAVEDEVVRTEVLRLGCPEVKVINNPKSSLGMFSSIRCAARWEGWEKSASHWVIVLGDQPHLRPATLHTLLSFAKTNPRVVCQPKYKERLAHPVLLPRTTFVALTRTRAATLKAFLDRQHVLSCPCDDPGLDLDIDRPNDYTQALRLAGL